MEELDIPIFGKTYELYKALHGFRGGIPKQDRHALWQRIESSTLEIIEHLFAASGRRKEEKYPYLERASVRLNMLRVLLRLAKDTKVIDMKKYARTQQMVDEIGRMLGGWMKSAKASDMTPPPMRIFEKRRRKCRAPDARTLELRLSGQLLLTLRRPSFQLSSAALPSDVRMCTLPSECTAD